MRVLPVSALAAFACLTSAQTVRLQLKFPAGETQRVTTAMSMKTTTEAGQSFEMLLNQSGNSMMKVLRATPQGGGVVRMTIGDEKTSMTLNGRAMTVPSTATATKGMSLTFEFLPNGRISNITGLDELLKKSGQTGLTPATGQSMRDMMNFSYGGILPDHPVRPGDKWSGDMSFNQGPMDIQVHLTSKLLRVENRSGHRMAVVGMTGTGSIGASGLPSNAGSMNMKTDKFDLTGTLLFDLNRGWFSKSSMKLKIHAHVNAGGQGQPAKSVGIGMDMSVDTDYTPVR
ncbi:MAG TPA: DUF6263 family protein [Fimbriimonadaceae bacterium]|nr:DUF6263 family protein [Fimbriimonadaceae bacterium]